MFFASHLFLFSLCTLRAHEPSEIKSHKTKHDHLLLFHPTERCGWSPAGGACFLPPFGVLLPYMYMSVHMLLSYTEDRNLYVVLQVFFTQYVIEQFLGKYTSTAFLLSGNRISQHGSIVILFSVIIHLSYFQYFTDKKPTVNFLLYYFLKSGSIS